MSQMGDSPSENGRQAEIQEMDKTLESLVDERKNLDLREEKVKEKIGPSEMEELKKAKFDFFHDLVADRIKRREAGEEIVEDKVDLATLPLEFVKGQRHEEQFQEDWSQFDQWLEENGRDLGDFEEEAKELFRIDLLRRTFARCDGDIKSKIREKQLDYQKLQSIEYGIKTLEDEGLPLEMIVETVLEEPFENLSPYLQSRIEEIRTEHPELITLEEFLEKEEEEE